MRKAYITILFLGLFILRDACAYDECFRGSCFSHLNDGWIVQGGVGCIKTGIKWHQKYNHSDALKALNSYYYIAVNSSSSDICNSPGIIDMEMITFHHSTPTLADFKESVRKAIDWCWLAANNKIKFSRKSMGDAVITDNHFRVSLFLYSDGTIDKTFVRMEIADTYTGKHFFFMHLNRQDLTRLKNEISSLERMMDN